MSLDVYLYANCKVNGNIVGDTLYEDNITHNLTKMAEVANCYRLLWRPEEIGVKYAKDLIQPLSESLKLLKTFPDFFEQFNPDNGWGDYEGLIRFVEKYLKACRDHPESLVIASR